MKKLFLITFCLYLVAFIFPSFRSQGVDCIAGCARSLGSPLGYSIAHGGGIANPPGYKSSNDFIALYLAIDIAYWLLAALVTAKILASIKSINSHKTILMRVGAFIFLAIAMYILGILVFLATNTFPAYGF